MLVDFLRVSNTCLIPTGLSACARGLFPGDRGRSERHAREVRGQDGDLKKHGERVNKIRFDTI